MRNRTESQNEIKEPRTRWGPLTRYESETSIGLESHGTPSSMKNFPRTFIPMRELEETPMDE